MSSAIAEYDSHMLTYSLHVDKAWHMKASELALKSWTPLHDHLASIHYKDAGGKKSGWVVWHSKHRRM